jgi:hypothetical protein
LLFKASPPTSKNLLRKQVSPWITRVILGLLILGGGVLVLDAAGIIRLSPHEAHPERFSGGDSIRRLMTQVKAIKPLTEGDPVDLPKVAGWVNGDKLPTSVAGKWVVLDIWALW